MAMKLRIEENAVDVVILPSRTSRISQKLDVHSKFVSSGPDGLQHPYLDLIHLNANPKQLFLSLTAVLHQEVLVHCNPDKKGTQTL